MMHLEAALQCPLCSHKFRACLDATAHPNPKLLFKVRCPMNGSWLRVPAAAFERVEACSGGCLAFILASQEPRADALGGGEGQQ